MIWFVSAALTLKLTCQTAYTEADTKHKTMDFTTELQLKHGDLVRLNFLLNEAPLRGAVF